MENAFSPVVRDDLRPQVFVEHSIPRQHPLRLARHLGASNLLSVPSNRSPSIPAREGPPVPPRQDGGSRGAVYSVFTRPGPSNPDSSFLNGSNRSRAYQSEQLSSQDELDGVTDDVLAFARRNGFDNNGLFQVAVIVDDYHPTSATRRRPDTESHIGVTFLEFRDNEMLVQTWRDEKEPNSPGRTIKLHVYPQGRDDLYGRPGYPLWVPAEVRSFPNANDEGEAWVRLNHARVVDFRQVDDSWKESPVDGTGHTLAEVAVQARAALRAVGGNLPRNPLRTEEPQYLSQRLLLPDAPVRTVRARPQPRRSAVPTVQDEDGFEPVVRRR